MTADQIDEDAGEGGGDGFIAQIPAILKQRRWLIIVPLIIGALGALIAIFAIPPMYKSAAVILVQSPQLPSDLVGSDPADSVDRRIARIREQITSRPDLVSLMDEHGLYSDERLRKPLSKVLEKMRKAIVLTPTVATTPGNGSNNEATVSFELSYAYARPAEAQAVAQDLTERLIQLYSTQNSTEAASTVQFLTDQASSLQKQIAEVEGQMNAISASNGRALAGSNMTVLGGGSGGIDVQIAQLQRDNSLMLGQRKALQDAGGDPLVTAAEAQLTAARAVYSDNHPDVIAAKQRLAEAKSHAQANSGKLSALQQLDQQIAFNNSQIASLRASKASENAQLAASLSAQSRGPLAQQQLTQLEQRLTGLNDQYKSVSGRLLAAKAGVRADSEQMGQKLTVVEPPVVPDTPAWPNRLLIGLLGPGAGLALGLMLALLVEMLARPIRGPNALVSLGLGTPLAMIPVVSEYDPKRKSNRRNSQARRRFAFFGRPRRPVEG